jgi:hypothetical protein
MTNIAMNIISSSLVQEMMIFVRWQFPYTFWKWKQGWLWKTLELLKENKDYIFEQAEYELIYLKT